MAVAKKIQKEVDINSILSSAVKGETKTKSTIPVVGTSETVAKNVDKIRELKEQLDSIQTMLDLKTAELVESVKKDREILCRQNYTSSIKVAGTKGTTVTLTWKDAYSKIGTENELTLRGIVSEKYDDLFMKKTKIEVKDEISEEKLSDLIKAVGPEKFKEYFSVEQHITPKSRYTTEYFVILSKEQRDKLETVVKQYKPSLKTK